LTGVSSESSCVESVQRQQDLPALTGLVADVRYNPAVAAHRPACSPTAAPFTKGEVNRAGVLLLDLRERMQRDGAERAVADSDEQKLDEAWEALTWWRSLYARPLSAVARNLRYHVDRGGGRVGDRIEVTQRLKRLDTLIGKLGRERGDVTQMQDIGGVRVVVPSLRHVYVVRRRLLKSWVIIRERNYITEPKSSGYRALHLIVRRMGYPIEVQLRTIGQDVWANQVEETGRQVGLDLKFGAGHEQLDNIFLEMAELIARFDRAELSPHDLREGLKHVPSLPIEEEAREDDPNEPC
jgi:putative GTP pyrophosphokinase